VNFTSGIIRIVGLIVIGAILANAIRNGEKTARVIGSVNDLFRTGLQAAGGQRIGRSGRRGR